MAIEVTDRDKRILSVVGIVAALVLVVGAPLLVYMKVRSRGLEIEELRQKLAEVQDARSKLSATKSRTEALKLRYGKKVEPSLPGFLEKLAREQKLEIDETKDTPPVAAGKKFSEKQVKIRLKKAGMLAIARFFESIEASGTPTVISRLTLVKRGASEADAYNVELTVSTYERNDDKKDAK